MTIAVSLGAMAGDAGRASRAPMSALLGRLAAGCTVAAVRRWQARQMRTALAEMDERMLEDIGLVRAPAGRVTHLWQRGL